MPQYIDKSALVAEIERIREHVKRLRYAVDANCIVTTRNACECLESSIGLLVNSIDTLEVKGVDLEKEIKDVCHDYRITDFCESSLGKDDIRNIANYFFELGLKA